MTLPGDRSPPPGPLPDSLPSPLPRPPGEEEALRRLWRLPTGLARLTAVNNSVVGVWYIATALLFFLIAGLLALAMRVQLAVPENTLLDHGTYNQFFTVHGTGMMFLFAVPIGGGDGRLPAARDARRTGPAIPPPFGLRLLGLRDRRAGPSSASLIF